MLRTSPPPTAMCEASSSTVSSSTSSTTRPPPHPFACTTCLGLRIRFQHVVVDVAIASRPRTTDIGTSIRRTPPRARPAATRSAAITTHTFAAVDRNILTVACSHFRNSAHLHDPVAGSRKFLGAGHGLISSGVARRASDRTIARLCGGHNFSLLGGGDSFVDPRSVGARSTTRTRAIAWSPAGREEEGATPFLRPGGGGEKQRTEFAWRRC